VGNTEAVPGATGVLVAIGVDDAAGIAGASLVLNYDTSGLIPKEVRATDLSTDFSVVSSLVIPGQVKIVLARARGISSGSGALVNVLFDVKAGAVPGRYVLTLSPYEIEGESQAIAVQNVTAGAVTVTGSGTSTPASSVSFRVGDASAVPGATGVLVAIEVDDAAGLAGANLMLDYDSSALIPKEVRTTELSTGFSVVPNLVIPGQVKIVLARARAVPSGSGPLANVSFDVKAGAVPGRYTLSLSSYEVEGETQVIQVRSVAAGTFTVTGTGGGTGGGTTPLVSTAPVLAPIGSKSIDEGQTLSFALTATEADGDALSFSVAGAPAGAVLSGATFTWIPTFEQAGSYSLVFAVSDGRGGTDSETVQIQVKDVAVTGVVASPAVWDCGDAAIGSTVERQFYLKSTGKVQAKVDSLVSSSSAFVVTFPALPVTIRAGDSAAVSVQFAPLQEGRETGSLTFSTSAGSTIVPLLGTGTVPEVFLRLLPREFGNVWVGQRKSLQVLLVNRGERSATIDSVQVLPPSAPVELVGLELPVVVPGRDSVEVGELEFAPATAGPLSGVSLRAKGRQIERSVLVRGRGVTPPQMAVDRDTLLLGPVGMGKSVSRSLQVRNTGGDTLHLSQINVEQEAFTFSPAELKVAPGSLATIRVSFRPTEEKEVGDRLELISDDPASPYRVHLRGLTQEGTPILSLAPGDSLRFGVVAQGESELQSLRVRNRGGGTLKVAASSESAEFNLEQRDTIRLAADQTQNVLVRFRPTKIGKRQGTLLFSSNDPEVPLTALVLQGIGGGLYFEPPSIEYGEVVLGTRVDTTVQVINQTSSRVDLTLDMFGAPIFAMDRRAVTLETGRGSSMKVSFRPNGEGSFNGKVEVRGQELELTLFGTGVAGPRMRVQPATLRDFGQAEVGKVGQGSFTVSNEGQGPLKVFDLVSSRLEYRVVQADSLPLVVQPGEDRRIDVVFTPLAKGEVPGVLTLVSNDPENRELVRALDGRGVEVAKKLPKLEVVLGGTGDGIDFGQLAEGEVGRQSLLISNVGTGVLEVKRIEADSRQVQAEPESLVVVGGESREVVLRVQPAAGAVPEGLVRILTNDPDRPVVRKRWLYTRPMPVAVVLTDTLSFGVVENGQRAALLTIWNRGNMRLVVDLVDDSGQLQFSKDRLVVEPDRVERSKVVYRGSGGSGAVVLASNDPGQRQVRVPWVAEALLALVRSVPASGATRVARTTVLSLFFNQPIRQAGQLAGLAGQGAGMVALQGRIVPEPKNAWRRKMQVQGTEVQIPLELEDNQAYQLIVVQAESGSGTQLAEPFEVSFATGTQGAASGQIAGQALFEDGTPLGGKVFVANAGRELVGSVRIGQDGSFALAAVPPGTYNLFAQEDRTAQSFAYSRAVTVRAGESVVGVDFLLPLQPLQPVAGVAPIEEAVAVDEAPSLLVDSTFVVSIRTDPVRDLTGFVVRVSFEPQAVTLVDVASDSLSQKNALYGAGGFPLFLSRTIDPGTVEYGGSLLGATATTAPDGGGLLAYITFRALKSDAEVSVESIVRRTLQGEDVVTGPKVRAKAPGKGADFDGNGVVDFGDFFQFADNFGKPATGAAAKFDLDRSGTVDFGDFFQFADNFGKRVAKVVPVGLELAEQEAVLQLEQQGKELRLQVGLVRAEGTRGYGLVLQYDPLALQYERVASAGLVLAQEIRPGLLAVGRSWQGIQADRVELVFGVLGQDPVIRVREGVVRAADGQVRELRLGGLPARAVPASFALAPAYPNPFNPQTTIRYQVPQAVQVHLLVYDVLGQRVRTLVDEVQEAGDYRAVWDGRDQVGKSMASGVYLCRLQAGAFGAVRKLVLMK
jgi:hypothetical protein